MNTDYRKTLPGSTLDYFDARAAVDAIQPGAYATLPYTSRVLAENLVRRCDPATLSDSLKQLIERRRDLDFPWFPARVVCHDILGQTALVDLAGLRDAIADKGGDPAKVNPNGSGIGLGHPIGATGAIITVKALHELQRVGGRYALVTMCIGGGQGIAAIFERI
ncbi:hypothetical protein G6F68_014033 [Rhizopus microsporus]|nr:hypothetical protein G6F68_014033 [Rhizopus microsporus]